MASFYVAWSGAIGTTGFGDVALFFLLSVGVSFCGARHMSQIFLVMVVHQRRKRALQESTSHEVRCHASGFSLFFHANKDDHSFFWRRQREPLPASSKIFAQGTEEASPVLGLPSFLFFATRRSKRAWRGRLFSVLVSFCFLYCLGTRSQHRETQAGPRRHRA